MVGIRASLLLARWCAIAVLAISLAGCGKDRRDALIMRNGTTLQGTLAGCDAKGCTLDGKAYPRSAIDWIGLAVGDATPPKVEHPETDEEHLRDGSVRSAQLLSIDAGTVVVAAASLPRAQVAFIHLARPSAASVPPNRTDPASPSDQPKSSSRVLHYSVRIQAHATHHYDNHLEDHHNLDDTAVEWTGVWPDVAIDVDETAGRIDPHHVAGTPYPRDYNLVRAEITASLAYHNIFTTLHFRKEEYPRNWDPAECKDSLRNKVYPADLQVAGSTKSGDSWFVFSAEARFPAGKYDPQLLAGEKSQSSPCEFGHNWFSRPPIHIAGLEFIVDAEDIKLTVHRTTSPEIFYPLGAILAHQSFTLDTGPQHWEMPSRDPRAADHSAEGHDDWQATIEFTALGGGDGTAPGSPDDCGSALAALGSERDRSCSALAAATARCKREVTSCFEQLGGLQRACDNATMEYQQRSAACASRR
jgi:hypothetical protein